MKTLEEISLECIARTKELKKMNRHMKRDMFIRKIKSFFKLRWMR